MAMKTLIKNGTIVTATDDYVGDVLHRRRDDRRDRHATCDVAGGQGRSTPRASSSSPAASTSTRTSTCPSAAPSRPTTSRPAPIAAAHGGTTTHHRLRHPGAAASTLRQACETWMGKAEGKATIDYGFHMIMTRAHRRRSSARWARMVERGRHLLQAVHGLPGRLLRGRRRASSAPCSAPARSAPRSACTPRTAS